MACTLAQSLGNPYTESSDSFVASTPVSIATRWNEPVPERELHPSKSSTFSRRTFWPTTERTRARATECIRDGGSHPGGRLKRPGPGVTSKVLEGLDFGVDCLSNLRR